eukprot:1158241-Pelagomonas_calceolata.AAC.6
MVKSSNRASLRGGTRVKFRASVSASTFAGPMASNKLRTARTSSCAQHSAATASTHTSSRKGI